MVSSSVLVVGCGGTGCACSSFLVRAGVGRLMIIDRDVVDRADLDRQILYEASDVTEARPKAHAAAARLAKAASGTEIHSLSAEFTADNALSLVSAVDLVVDCTDNMEARMLINEACLDRSIPWIHGACVSTMGMVVPFPAHPAACYRCIVGRIRAEPMVSSCRELGILGPVAGMVGCIEAIEALKMLIDPALVRQRLIYVDGLAYTYETVGVKAAEGCPACKKHEYEHLERGAAGVADEACGQNGIHIRLGHPLDLARISQAVSGTHGVRDWGDALTIEVGDRAFVLFGDGRAIVMGTTDAVEARAMISVFVEP